MLTPQRFSRLQVEAGALADDLRVFEDLKVSRERLALNLHALLALEVGFDVRKRCGGTEVVDDVVAHLVEHGDVLNLHASADVLFEDLLDYRRDVSALVGESRVIPIAFGKPPSTNARLLQSSLEPVYQIRYLWGYPLSNK